MKQVSEFEAKLLRILRCILGRFPKAQAYPLIFRTARRPKCLSRDCVHLIQDSLAKGMTTWAAQHGWRRDRFLQGEAAVSGRVWERYPPENLGLSYSPSTVSWLIWITASNPGEPQPSFDLSEDQLTLGDRLLLFRAYEMMRGWPAAEACLKQKVFADHGLIWLCYAEDAARAKARVTPDYSPWLERENSWVIESLQHTLAERWRTMEFEKRGFTDPQVLKNVGEAQTLAIDSFLDAAETRERYDLARFLLDAGRRLLRREVERPWFRRLQMGGLRLAERTNIYRAGLSLFASLGRLRTWERRARGIGYYDEGYAAAQLWLSDWETWNADAVCGRAADIIRDYEPLKT